MAFRIIATFACVLTQRTTKVHRDTDFDQYIVEFFEPKTDGTGVFHRPASNYYTDDREDAKSTALNWVHEPNTAQKLQLA